MTCILVSNSAELVGFLTWLPPPVCHDIVMEFTHCSLPLSLSLPPSLPLPPSPSLPLSLPPSLPLSLQNIKFFSVPLHTPVILAQSGDCATTQVRFLCGDASGHHEKKQPTHSPAWVMDIVSRVRERRERRLEWKRMQEGCIHVHVVHHVPMFVCCYETKNGSLVQAFRMRTVKRCYA